MLPIPGELGAGARAQDLLAGGRACTFMVEGGVCDGGTTVGYICLGYTVWVGIWLDYRVRYMWSRIYNVGLTAV